MSEQLSLGIGLRDSARFSNFVVADNREAVDALQCLAEGRGESQLLIHGAPGTGRTHLLQACCHRAATSGRSAAYLPLAEAVDLSPDMVLGWEQYALVCIDDVEAVAAYPLWQEALFHLYNRVQQAGGGLVVSAAAAPAALALELADLVSRLAAGPIYHLQRLNESQALRALSLRARQRGFELPEDTARYLLKRVPRDLPALMRLLERLDSASLAAQRRLTVPFVKSVLNL